MSAYWRGRPRVQMSATGLLHRLEHPRRTHEAKDLEFLDKGVSIVNPIMAWHRGATTWRESRARQRRFEEGQPVHQRPAVPTPLALFMEANVIGGRHGLGISDRSRTASSRQEPGHLEAPGLALLYIVYERLVTGIHNEDTIDQYRANGRRSAACSIRRGSTAALMLRETPSAGGTRGERRGDARTAARQRLLDRRHHEPQPHLPPERLTMEKGTEVSSAQDRIGQLTMRTWTSSTRGTRSASTTASADGTSPRGLPLLRPRAGARLSWPTEWTGFTACRHARTGCEPPSPGLREPDHLPGALRPHAEFVARRSRHRSASSRMPASPS